MEVLPIVGIKSGDVLVGIHIWETTSFKDLRYILVDLRSLSLIRESASSFFAGVRSFSGISGSPQIRN